MAGLLQIKQIVEDLDVTPALKHADVTLPAPGNPQTLLLIGSDHRAGEPYKDVQHRHDDARPDRPELLDDQPAVGPA